MHAISKTCMQGWLKEELIAKVDDKTLRTDLFVIWGRNNILFVIFRCHI